MSAIEYAVTNPATGETLKTFDVISDDDLKAAIGRAHDVRHAWGRDTSVEERAKVIARVAELHNERKEELGAIITREMGKLKAGDDVDLRVYTGGGQFKNVKVKTVSYESLYRSARRVRFDADERAADHHEPRVLASALVAVTSAGGSAAGAPSGDASVAGSSGSVATDALARVHRILRPPDRLPWRREALTRAAVVALTVAPLVLATAPAVVALL